jgi:hypothetical protein
MLDRNGVSASDLKLVTVFVLERHSSARRRAVCERWTHPHGWELRLLINQQLARCTVCYSDTECTDTAEAWRQENGQQRMGRLQHLGDRDYEVTASKRPRAA